MNTRIRKRILSLLLVFALCFSFSISESQAMTAHAIGSTQNTATDLIANGQWSESVMSGTTDPVHWYRINVTTDGVYELRLMSYFGSLAFEVFNYDLSIKYAESSYWPIEGTENSPKTKTIGSWVWAPGTYYVKLYMSSNKVATGKYGIAFFTNELYTDLNVGDSTYNNPVNVEFGKTYIGDFNMTYNEPDWYKINVTDGKYYVVSLKSFFNSLGCQVYNYDLSKCLFDTTYWPVGGESGNPGAKNVELKMEPGVYYVKLSGGKGKYNVTIGPLSSENCNHDYEVSRTLATYFDEGFTTHTCKKCGHSYIDNKESKKVLQDTDFNRYQTKNKNKKVTLNWNTINDASGYEIQYSTDKKFKKSNTATVKGFKKSKTTIKKNLKKNKKYYFRIRTYVKSGNKTAYSKWSKKYSLKIK